MKAMVIREFGGPEVFKLEEVSKPTLKPGHVLIRVEAACMNPIDVKIRGGLVKAATETLPAILHGDVAGVVEAVADDVEMLTVGDKVYGLGGGVKGTGGALAEYMLVDADLLAIKPKNLFMDEAACCPVVALTAWDALVNRGKVQVGHRVLIHGATGGVGHMAIQIAKHLGAEVYATASSDEKIKIANKLGAHHVINYKETSVEEYVNQYTEGKGFDLVFDTVGGENLDRSFEAAAMTGTVISTNTRSTHDLSMLHAKGLNLHVVFLLLPLLHGSGRKEMGYTLRRISQLIEQEIIKPLLDEKTYGFSEVSLAHRQLESGQAIGKIALFNDLASK
ncbi:Alcohol dehydrogenase, zinc-binding domain protein [Alkaliphilus metalliredigens QYMF]|uniref:Alcohol dehydrogenase, zinc-binding domain protein n=1 Tax=Alkaliphilus metalliredigens (strain QYMF) TaxID=293826 RepID=A6TL37_ALKMQ|nr:zinc-dependent alcohol dehydrogenase family protein [Alkaliphilus metalliredigens]ABR46905.1 Alcohol dehydrogenase, zinc-binding domain protein [Alkaliphilus metalliredigens QYMF]